jgi:hypothetical protein
MKTAVNRPTRFEMRILGRDIITESFDRRTSPTRKPRLKPFYHNIRYTTLKTSAILPKMAKKVCMAMFLVQENRHRPSGYP